MELVTFLRLLWRYRIAMAVGFLVALALGFLATRGAETHVTVASTRVVLDTPESQLIEDLPTGADTLVWRAALLADLAASDSLRTEIESQAHVADAQLAVTAPYMATPPVVVPLPVAALSAAEAQADAEPFGVAVQGVDNLPIISINTHAPTRGAAVRLAHATASVLESAAAAHRGEPRTQSFVVEDVGPVKAKTITDGPRKIAGAIVVILVFGLWCFVLAFGTGIHRRRKYGPNLGLSRRLRGVDSHLSLP